MSSALGDDPEWPFHVLADTPVPEVDSDWPRNEIDSFVLARLVQKQLSPAPEANRHQLVRRLYFDLLGLPPTPEDVQQFVQDPSPQAWGNLVDRLLKDPRYGERWARLWLDLARYADTAGYEGDPDLPHAWRYRDYVIDVFNSDRPYDQFIREQIAGDEFSEVMGAGDLPKATPEQIVAMTFLRLAPFTEPRGDETRHELLSEMTSTVGSVFLGLTVGCAKCHDHKYDNIPTADFYRLKAFFSTVSMPRPEPGDAYQIGGSIPAAFYRDGEQKWAAAQETRLEGEIEKSRLDLSQLRTRLTAQLGSGSGFGLQAMGGSLGNNYIYGRTVVNNDLPHVSITNCDGDMWEFFSDSVRQKTGSNAGSNRGQWFGDIPQVKYISLGQYTEGTPEVASPAAFHDGQFAQVLIYDRPLNAQERADIQKWLSMPGKVKPPSAGLRFWLDASDLDADPQTPNPSAGHISRWTDKISGVTLRQAETEKQPATGTLKLSNGTVIPSVRFENDFLIGLPETLNGEDAPELSVPFVSDQKGALVVLYSARHTHEGYGFTVGGDGAFLGTFINPGAVAREQLDVIAADESNEQISEADRRQLRWLSGRERFLRQQIKRLAPVAMSVRHSYGPPYEPGVPTSRIMIRGEYDNPGAVVEAGFPVCVTGHQKPAEIRLDPFKRWPTRSRRMALANWIASPQNPLTARVMVNRLWHWHFGRGIVATPSDFGQLSGGPSHPELLDWLAAEFVKKKWSLKSMHRLMLTSAAWRQTSVYTNAAAEQVDPDNVLVWRFRRRRLEAEAVRDAVLFASGRLNPKMFGLPVFPPLPDDIDERVKYSESKWSAQPGPEGRRRSIYVYQQRSLTMPFMQSFDALVCDESRPRRSHSVTPLQALAMYNGQFVSEEANHFAARIQREVPAQIEQQIRRAFHIATGRGPNAAEAKLLSELASTNGLRGVCRVLLNSNEFIYVD